MDSAEKTVQDVKSQVANEENTRRFHSPVCELVVGGWRGPEDEIPKGGWRGPEDEIPKGGWR